MGVHGLWKLLEPAGKIIPLEGMAGQVLAVDVSIWLHQAIKGMHDSHGAPLAIAHLLLLFHRLCKLLFYKIKPVFVFDGGVPILKREVMSSRGQIRSAAKSEALKVRGKLLKNLLKHEVVRQVLSERSSSEILGLNSFALPGTSQEEDLYKLPPIAEKPNEDTSDDDGSVEEEEMKLSDNIHSVDITSSDFKNLPPEIRHEILLELIETRKQSSWKHLDKMPKESGSFSDFQMNRLLKRRAVQSSLDEVSKEMGAKSMSLKDLENLLLDQRYPLNNDEILPSKRIAQNDQTRYVFVHKTDDNDNTKNLSNLLTKDVEKKESSNSECDFQCSFDSGIKTSSVNTTMDEQNTTMDELEEGLTQHEIYNLIMKEKECNKVESETSFKSSMLTKQTQIKITDDVMEVLPLLGMKDSELKEIQSNSDLILPNISRYIKKEVTNESREKLKILEESKSNVENSEISESKSNANQESQNESHELVSTFESAHLMKNVEGKFQSLLQSYTPAKINPYKLTEKNCKTDLLNESIKKPENNFIQSEESDDDFELVVEKSPNHIGENKYVNMNEKIDNKIQVFVKVDEICKADDIFDDIFNHNSKTDTEKIKEKGLNQKSKRSTENIESTSNESSFITEGDIIQMQNSIENECNDLLKEQGKQERFAQNISEQMNLDAQELLRLFGIPYVVAPMEAEAQCAILNVLGLTDGTITDDSDIWLFGGKVVYKNFFNQKKHVLKYMAQDIEKNFQLCREDLIKMALLVGSDYTSGIDGVGPVTALEILGAFPSSSNEEILSGLKKFRNWISEKHEMTPAMRSLRKKLKNIKLSPGFPSEAVLEAYLHPHVDCSKEPFSWAKPNVPLLQKYTKLKFGWTEKKCSELLMPVMKRLLDNRKNKTIEKYFERLSNSSLLEGAISKRVENAIKQLRNGECVFPHGDLNNSGLKKKRGGNNLSNQQSKNKINKSQLRSKKVSQETNIPQKLATEKMLEDRKRKAIKIFRKTSNKKAKSKVKTVVKQEINLSESSSED